MTPAATWLLLTGVILLGVAIDLAAALLVDDHEQRQWERDAERWQRVREKLDR